MINLIKANSKVKSNLKNIAFYMDNCKIHHANVLKNLKQKINILFGPPYSPCLNAIEEIFGNWKHFLRKNLFKN